MDHLAWAFETLVQRFARVIWVPGNHELWSVPGPDAAPPLRGLDRYHALVALARSHRVITPEDDYPLWDGAGGPCRIAPLFLLYDYSFRPDGIGRDQVAAWAAEIRNTCADEIMLDPTPFPSREAWCAHRLAETEARLSALDMSVPTVLINHFPLRADLIHIPRAPRFLPWCGTTRTQDWHWRFNAKVVVTGHLHTRRTDWRDGTRFEEVSLGYPRHWRQEAGMAHYLREILPGNGHTHTISR